MTANLPVPAETVLDSLASGLYVTNRERRILYWSKTAEAITGWSAEDVTGRRCCDSVLDHIDKDGHRLCGELYCPLFRAMETDRSAETQIIVFARGKDGSRIPMRVAVAPLRDERGEVVGGVETFQDLRGEFRNVQRAKRIQLHAMKTDLPDDPRVTFTTRYIPQDVIGGDFCHVRALDADRYSFVLADVTGHGPSAALYTMYISLLLRDHQGLAGDPAELAGAMNARLSELVEEESFAAATVGLVDLAARRLDYASCGTPGGLRAHEGRPAEILDVGGLPWGIIPDAKYRRFSVEFAPGDCCLLCTDGATEVNNRAGDMLDMPGLAELVTQLGYPNPDVRLATIEERLLAWSNDIRLPDDLTLLEIRRA